MEGPKKVMYDKSGAKLVQALEKRNMEGYYCPTAEEAVAKVLELIPMDHTVSWGGAMTVDQLGIKQKLARRGQPLIDRDTARTPEERDELLHQALSCGTFLMSSNAITIDGELINIDGAGNRVACLCHGPRHVVIAAGMNKVVKTIEDGVHRVRNAAAPPNSLRVGVKTPCSVTGTCQDCLSDGCICSDLVITRRSMVPGRIKVVLIGEDYGF